MVKRDDGVGGPAAAWEVATGVLRMSAALVDGVQTGVLRRGFDDVRPAHGFAFSLISRGPTTAARLAEHLGITKQATAELVQHLVDRGYVERRPDPDDGRSRLLVLTARGVACTRAAEEAAAETVEGWRTRLGDEGFAALRSALSAAGTSGPLRPSW